MTRELDTLRKRQWRFERQNRWDYLPRAKQLQAIAILVLAGWNAVIPAEFCIAQALRRHSDAVQDVSLWAASVSEWCLACTDEAIASIHHPNNKEQERVRQEAIKWLAERETVEWCKHQNFDHGVAPSTNDLANRFVKSVYIESAGCVGVCRCGCFVSLGRKEVRDTSTEELGPFFCRHWKKSLKKRSRQRHDLLEKKKSQDFAYKFKGEKMYLPWVCFQPLLGDLNLGQSVVIYYTFNK
jgi:hypothetical protein